MNKRKDSSADSRSIGDTSATGFHKLSHDILNYANHGLLKRDFIIKVSTILLNHIDCDELELWVSEEEVKHYRCRVNRSKKVYPVVDLLDFSFDTLSEFNRGYSDLDSFSIQVIRGCEDLSLQFITEDGSFWTNDTHQPIKFTNLINGEIQKSTIKIQGAFGSYAIVPLKSNGRSIGLMHLKIKEKDFITSEYITFCEDISQTLVIAFEHQHTQIELRERLKELTCLYNIAKVVAKPNSTFEEIMQGIVELLPPAWLYTDISSARIILEGQTYITTGFQPSPFMQSSDVVVDGKRVGSVDLAYSEKRADLDEGAFLNEERSLIDIVAREVAQFYGRKKAEEEKSFLQDQLRHADRLATIGQLAAGVAHELNEPLGNILGFAQLAQKSPGLQVQVLKDMDKIVSASLHAREIIKKLMVFARQLPPSKMPIILNETVEDGIYFFEARCVKAGIDLVRSFSEDLPEITADPGQLNQVLVNLLVNAIQAMPDGGVLTIGTKTEGNTILLYVEDTGIGMPDDVIDQIFVPFFTTKDINEGTGLGLPVVHGIVTSHMGSIIVKSRVGSGTRFEIRLPITDPTETKENL